MLWYFVRISANVLVPAYLKAWIAFRCPLLGGRSGDEVISKKPRIVVSMTSFPGRVGSVWKVVACLLRQSVRPDDIIVWLSQDQFHGDDAVPQSLRQLVPYGVQVRMVDGDIRSHKKWYYAMLENPDDTVIIVDDDVLYSKFLIESLLAQHATHPTAIVANIAHRMTYHDGVLLPYGQWQSVGTPSQGRSLIPIGVGGVLYPPRSLPAEAFNLEALIDSCPDADDVWLKACALATTADTITTGFRSGFIPIMHQDSGMLYTKNVIEGGNDRQIARAARHFARVTGGRVRFDRDA